jgi:ion channel POLLUX/CASTOR
MNQLINLKRRLLYAFDNSISRGTGSIIVWIFLVFSGTIFSMALLVWLAESSSGNSLSEQSWIFVETVLGYFKYQPNRNGFYIYSFATFILFATSVLLSGALIGAITNGLRDKLAELRHGHSNIIESGHTVILGWSPNVFTIISELLIANQNQKKSSIVILGTPSRLEMSKEIDRHFGKKCRTKILCRQGDRRILNDLAQLSLETSKSIIINPYTIFPGDIVKSLLAVINGKVRKDKVYHVVAAVDNHELFKTCEIIGKNEVEVVHASDFFGRLEAQTCRQAGLPYVYTELLNFAGDEIYFQLETKLYGKTYGEILNLYHNSAIIGLCTETNKILLNPDSATEIREGFKIIAISEDDDTINLDDNRDILIDDRAINSGNMARADPEHYLILGWNSTTLGMLNNLDDYVVPGSSVEILYSDDMNLSGETNKFKKLKVNSRSLKFHSRSNLDRIDFSKFRAVIIQGNEDIGIENSDTLTMSLLINLRDIRDNVDFSFAILTELFDGNNQNIVKSVQSDDFIISDIIINSAVVQISENKLLAEVFKELFKSDGSEIYLKPAENYIREGVGEVNFFTVIESALRKKETAIGYRLSQYSGVKSRFVGNKEMTFGVILNPEKNQNITLSRGDSIIVLSEN